MTREQRLRGALEAALNRLVTARGGHDEQVIFEALGECLTWLCALDELFWPGAGYESTRDADPQGHVLPGLRRARNAVVHGDPVVGVADIADSTTVPTPQVIVASGARRSQVIMPLTRIAWTFKPNLPQPPHKQRTQRRYATEEQIYAADVAGQEVLVPIGSAVDWLDRKIAGRP